MTPVRKAISKVNSPVKKTGQKSSIKKRLLKAKEEELAGGREKILQAARMCFARQGFAGTSIKDIQHASGFSRGNLYHHFKTKEEIVQIIITQNLGSGRALMETIIQECISQVVDIKELIQRFTQLTETVTKGPGKGMAFHVWSLAMVDADVRKVLVVYFEQIRAALETYILVLQNKGKLAKTIHAKELSSALFGIVIPGFSLQSVYFDDMAITTDQYTNSLEVLFNKM